MIEAMAEGQTALLGDDAEDPPSSESAVQEGDGVQNSPELRSQAEPVLEIPSSSIMQEVTLKWLFLVFVVTLLLLVFQVVAGLCSHSLALLADSAHSSIDVITYGINYFVEKLKARSSAQGQDLSDSASLAVKVDVCGGVTSTVALLVATGFAASEAIARLRGAPSDEEKDEFSIIGPVLLVFAVVSTLANLGILVTFVRWQAAAKEAIDRDAREQVEFASFQAIPDFPALVPTLPFPAAPPQLLATAMQGGSGASKPAQARPSALLAADPFPTVPTLAPLDLESAAPEPPSVDNMPAGAVRPSRRGGRSLSRGRAARTLLNISSDYSSVENGCSPACGSNCAPGACEIPGLGVDGGGNLDGSDAASKLIDCSDSCCAPGPDGQQSWQSMLHMLVHPGCTDASHAAQGEDLRPGGETVQTIPAKQSNLNLSAAMLHLIADVVRGITILVSAVVIQAGIVSDAGKADAVCALLVAVFILIGAAAIFQRLLNALWSSCSLTRRGLRLAQATEA